MGKRTDLSATSRIDMIREAIRMIEDARDIVDEAVKGLSIKANYEAYGKYGFDTLLGQGNPYNDSLFSIIKDIEEEEE